MFVSGKKLADGVIYSVPVSREISQLSFSPRFRLSRNRQLFSPRFRLFQLLLLLFCRYPVLTGPR
jgi:hypothetical protein